MGVPFKNKLSYLFGGVVNQGVLYGRVHTATDKQTVYSRDLAMSILFDRYPARERTVYVDSSRWLEAKPLKDGAFKLVQCDHEEGQGTFRKIIGEYEAQQLAKAAAMIETAWRREGFKVDCDQPFAGRLIADYRAPSVRASSTPEPGL